MGQPVEFHERRAWGETTSLGLPKTYRFEYLVTLIVNVVLLYAFTHASQWDIPFLTDDISLVLPALKLSCMVTIVGSAILLVYDKSGVREFAHIVFNGLGIYVLYRLFTVYPFDFSSLIATNMEPVVKIVFGVGILGTFIGIIAESAKFTKTRKE